MMLEADGIIANLTPWRGVSADVGTVYELGFMCALNKAAYAYTNVAPAISPGSSPITAAAMSSVPAGHRAVPTGSPWKTTA